MPRILIVADTGGVGDGGEVVYSERVTPAHLQGEHAGRQLVERLAWAVADADRVESERPASRSARRPTEPEVLEKEQAWIPT